MRASRSSFTFHAVSTSPSAVPVMTTKRCRACRSSCPTRCTLWSSGAVTTSIERQTMGSPGSSFTSACQVVSADALESRISGLRGGCAPRRSVRAARNCSASIRSSAARHEGHRPNSSAVEDGAIGNTIDTRWAVTTLSRRALRSIAVFCRRRSKLPHQPALES